jgi:transposase-like protein
MFLPSLEQPVNTVQKNGHAPTAVQIEMAVSRPNPEVTQRAPRRSFTTADKLRILAEADACKQSGQLGALLRREGLYSSTLANFRKQRDAGKLGKDPALVRQQRLEKEATRQRDLRKIARLEAENKKLKVLIELQKKVAELMSLSEVNSTDA